MDAFDNSNYERRYWTNAGPGDKPATLTYEQYIIWITIQKIEAEKEGKEIFPGLDR